MLKTLVQDYEYIHVTVGIFGNLLFVIGSVFFLPALGAWQVAGVWMFIIGSSMMLVGAIGDALKRLWESRDRAAHGPAASSPAGGSL